MLSLDLSRIRTAREHFEQVYAPEAFQGDAQDVFFGNVGHWIPLVI